MLFPLPQPLPCIIKVMQPAAERNLKKNAGNVLLVLVLVQVKVQMQVQAEVQQMPVLLVAEVVKQHTSMPNLEANSCKQEQMEAHRGVEEVRKHPTELSELGVETYDIQGSPKPSGHVNFVGPCSEHVLDLSEVFDL